MAEKQSQEFKILDVLKERAINPLLPHDVVQGLGAVVDFWAAAVCNELELRDQGRVLREPFSKTRRMIFAHDLFLYAQTLLSEHLKDNPEALSEDNFETLLAVGVNSAGEAPLTINMTEMITNFVKQGHGTRVGEKKYNLEFLKQSRHLVTKMTGNGYVLSTITGLYDLLHQPMKDDGITVYTDENFPSQIACKAVVEEIGLFHDALQGREVVRIKAAFNDVTMPTTREKLPASILVKSDTDYLNKFFRDVTSVPLDQKRSFREGRVVYMHDETLNGGRYVVLSEPCGEFVTEEDRGLTLDRLKGQITFIPKGTTLRRSWSKKCIGHFPVHDSVDCSKEFLLCDKQGLLLEPVTKLFPKAPEGPPTF